MAGNPHAYETIRQEIISLIVEQSPDGDVVVMCKIAAQELAKRCPVFHVKSGRIIDYFKGSWNHYWCETPNGDIVDPTVDQFCPPLQYPNGEIWDYPIKPEDIEIIEIPSHTNILCGTA